MSQIVHVVFPCNDGAGAGLLAVLKEALVETRAFDGCEAIEVYTSADAPDDVVLWETFASRAHHEAYLGWRVETGMLDMLAPVLRSDLQVAYLDHHADV
ncbi:MAG: putative quinol monooxygenase [Acidimicrobiales bacterium]